MLKKHKGARDVTGQRFGELVAMEIDEVETSKHGRIYWKCKCDCGNISSRNSSQLFAGKVRSCSRGSGHRMSRTRQYGIWHSIIQRCCNNNNSNYVNYGNRGISVCDKWLTFEGFWEDMKDGYDDTLSIERKDNNGNYEKSNCRWATMKEQANNRRNTPFYTIDGEKMRADEIAEKYNISIHALKHRLRRGWDAKLAATTAVETKFHKKRILPRAK